MTATDTLPAHDVTDPCVNTYPGRDDASTTTVPVAGFTPGVCSTPPMEYATPACEGMVTVSFVVPGWSLNVGAVGVM